MNRLERLGFAAAAADWLEGQPAEGHILCELVRLAPEVVATEQLLLSCGHRRRPGTTGCLRVRLHHLRTALADLGHAGAIESVFGQGYRFVGDAKALIAEVEARA